MKRGSYEWYLYHDKQNEEPVIPLLLLSAFLLICKGGILTIIFIWTIYFCWASKNNERLNHDPEILRERESFKKIRNIK